ncbi:MFS transporter [Arthrobacter cavernae]|uniref:MFS transporter n=1 Tax=Arthrobacter cavernae TaxID=2817681 RepID=A0A939KN19_9MICC|nr:MFS transporter [Arthrobacter cavernae]MBO1268816.1 MFS transporter [Arthrobacter cavernae]
MSTLYRRHVLGIAGAHCASAFAALGLPPYLGVLLPQLGDPSARWAGVLYVLPTLFTALSAGVWGRLADRFGPKPLLIRAQIGLALAFALAAVAQDLPTLVVALVTQGVLGGTYSASTAYLASGLSGEPLSRGLALMQGSARTALVAAPVLAGLLAGVLDIRQMYGLAALLPLVAALCMLRMPALGRVDRVRPTRRTEPEATDDDGAPRRAAVTLAGLCTAEAGFVLVTVSTYPYFVPLMHLVAPWLPTWAPGLLFAAPHVIYLAFAAVVLRALRGQPRVGLTIAYAAAAASAVVHLVPVFVPGPGSLAWLLAGRLLLGVALALGLPALSLLAAEAAPFHTPGALFGRVEASSKSGAVLAGGTASALATLAPAALGPAAPLVIPLAAGAVLACTARRMTTPQQLPSFSIPVPVPDRSLT